MSAAVVLGVAQAVLTLAPLVQSLLPAARRAVAGEATDEDIAALEAGRDALNVQATSAEQRVIDGGTSAPGE